MFSSKKRVKLWQRKIASKSASKSNFSLRHPFSQLNVNNSSWISPSFDEDNHSKENPRTSLKGRLNQRSDSTTPRQSPKSSSRSSIEASVIIPSTPLSQKISPVSSPVKADEDVEKIYQENSREYLNINRLLKTIRTVKQQVYSLNRDDQVKSIKKVKNRIQFSFLDIEPTPKKRKFRETLSNASTYLNELNKSIIKQKSDREIWFHCNNAEKMRLFQCKDDRETFDFQISKVITEFSRYATLSGTVITSVASVTTGNIEKVKITVNSNVAQSLGLTKGCCIKLTGPWNSVTTNNCLYITNPFWIKILERSTTHNVDEEIASTVNELYEFKCKCRTDLSNCQKD